MKKFITGLLIILIISAFGVGGWFLWDNLQKEKNRTNELENKIASLNISDEKNNYEDSKEENKSGKTIQTYDSLKGTYESQKINLNEGTNLEPYYQVYTIVLSQEGTFAAYYELGDTSCHYVGYYTIDEKEIVLHSVVVTGNDPSASLCNEVLKFTLNSDGTFSDKKNTKFTKISNTPREETNIAKIINSYMAGCTTSGKNGEGPWFSGLENE